MLDAVLIAEDRPRAPPRLTHRLLERHDREANRLVLVQDRRVAVLDSELSTQAGGMTILPPAITFA
ncbi:hypothetical protein ACYZX9_10350 [Sphingomonas citri]|uniref:Uncharacterized protein n=1 Tax=Sphingomonas citri TaxID=2862499 RepID=A0ABS7BTY0_9SPHN|nr:hypothetical protein [Sphingomonas citri]MBW6533057.1 hypothetical protein [Sphingomonas citri]